MQSVEWFYLGPVRNHPRGARRALAEETRSIIILQNITCIATLTGSREGVRHLPTQRRTSKGRETTNKPGENIALEAMNIEGGADTSRPGGSIDLEVPGVEDEDEGDNSGDGTDIEEPGSRNQVIVEATTNPFRK